MQGASCQVKSDPAIIEAYLGLEKA
jgi:hypothetical protein